MFVPYYTTESDVFKVAELVKYFYSIYYYNTNKIQLNISSQTGIAYSLIILYKEDMGLVRI